jgi:GNAT superfamily N-acetyltransferase
MAPPASKWPNAEHPTDGGDTLLIRKAENICEFGACLALVRAHINELQMAEALSYLDVTPASLANDYGGLATGFFLGSRPNALNIGCIAYKPVPAGVAQLNYFYVTPDQRGRGTGRALLKAALDRSRDDGFEEVVLSTLPNLRSARALYIEFGFSETDAMFEDLPGAIFYRKNLK